MEKIIAILQEQEAHYALWAAQNTDKKEEYDDAVLQIRNAIDKLTQKTYSEEEMRFCWINARNYRSLSFEEFIKTI